MFESSGVPAGPSDLSTVAAFISSLQDYFATGLLSAPRCKVAYKKKTGAIRLSNEQEVFTKRLIRYNSANTRIKPSRNIIQICCY